MNEQEHLFSQLNPNDRATLQAFYKESLEANFRESRNAAWELAKVLLTVNSGAAARLFIVIRSSAVNSFLIAAFYIFGFGVFFDVAAYFVGAVHFAGSALGGLSFICIIVGGIMAGAFLIKQPQQISHTNSSPHQNFVLTNSPTKKGSSNTTLPTFPAAR